MKFVIISLILMMSLQTGYAQTIKEYSNIEDFYARINNSKDTSYIVNFWATWCAPCVKELPHFFEAEKVLEGKPIKFIFLSLDFKKDIDKRVLPFIKKRNILSEVAVLTDTDANHYINFVNVEWDGAIPATMIYQNETQIKFTQHEFENSKELINFITNK
jgi:thiol-disulfide isomerase/thioredoxin